MIRSSLLIGPLQKRDKFKIDIPVYILCLLALTIIHPSLSILFVLFISFGKNSNIYNNGLFVVLVALDLALITSSRTIYAFPADDLITYYSFLHTSKSLSFYEIIIEFRFEPVLFWIYKLFLSEEIAIRTLLFYNSFLVSIAYLFTARSLVKHFKLPYWSFSFFILAFPFEITSNIPRQILASLLMLWFLYSFGLVRYVYILLALFTHKSTLAIFIFSKIPFFNKYWLLYLMVMLLISFSGGLLIDLYMSSGMGGRIASFFLREASGKFFVYAVLSVLVIVFLLYKDYRKDYMVFLYISVAAVLLSDAGPLGVRLAYLVYLPVLVGLILITMKFKFKFKLHFMCSIIVIIFILRVTFLPKFGTHDPHSEISVLESFFYIYRIL